MFSKECCFKERGHDIAASIVDKSTIITYDQYRFFTRKNK